MPGRDDTPEAWFRELGYDIDVARDDGGIFWATLTSSANPAFVIERYGRGATEEEAAAAARRRWQVEQIGSPADRQRPQDRPLP